MPTSKIIILTRSRELITKSVYVLSSSALLDGIIYVVGFLEILVSLACNPGIQKPGFLI